MSIDHSKEDTITAIATPLGQAGIGIICISGPEATKIAQQIFIPQNPVANFKSHHLYLGRLMDPSSNIMIDEVLLSCMKAPNSYTREDVIEINSHSGYLLLSRILKIVIDQGARLAKPGEFTFRAFMNGRIDLTQAEAVVDLINSKSYRGLQIASKQISGSFSEQIMSMRQSAVDLLAHLEVAIDFPEEELEILSEEARISRIEKELIEPTEKTIAAYGSRKVWMEGISSVIVGRVNAGKSSLLNCLLKEERAIVTEIPGTTRDTIESTIHIEGVPLRLIDTAGFRKVKGKVERIGIELTEKKLAEADLSLIVIDSSRPLNQDDLNLIARSDKEKSLIIINKTDLPCRMDIGKFKKKYSGWNTAEISAKTGKGIDTLQKAILELVLEDDPDALLSQSVPNLRHRDSLNIALESFQNARDRSTEKSPAEIIASDVKEGLDALGEIIGESADEEILDRIFSQFCIGK